jgi:hypothetical protein
LHALPVAAVPLRGSAAKANTCVLRVTPELELAQAEGDRTMSTALHLVVAVPSSGEQPSEFRHQFVLAVHESASRAYASGRLAPELLEEIRRAVPIQGQRQ